jgi:hypothetical protein
MGAILFSYPQRSGGDAVFYLDCLLFQGLKARHAEPE